jgi:plastocyanin
MKRLTLTLGLLALAAVLAACSGASAANPGTAAPDGPGAPSGDAVSIVAKDIKFVQTDVTVAAAAPFAIAFDNQDGAPHNVAISNASGQTVFKGDIVSSTKVTYQVPALAAGSYAFICEVHPDMKGTITAN